MQRPPPRPLFPYTTLFRSAPATPGRGEPPKEERSPEPRATAKATDEDVADRVVAVVNNDAITRSEEHTSELQSHSDLVCRLLLEKKKRASGARALQAPGAR